MNIAENILKHNLRNVYFLTGTALAGKTTMATALAEKHGFIHFNEHWTAPHFKVWQSIYNERYQPISTLKKETIDWDAHFDRPAEDISADNAGRSGNDEYNEFVIIELIKRSQTNKVIADVCMPIELLTEISDYSRIACLLASPELVTCENYGARASHKEYLEWIMSLNEPEKKITKQNEVFRIEAEMAHQEARKYNLFSVVRTKESMVEDTLRLLEKHFGF
ncbi:MAG: hypothetical protein FWC96_08695 [Oscillospiraceae bacterium]|nr:hypothetical protein [Oscillospiraceae bacterium]